MEIPVLLNRSATNTNRAVTVDTSHAAVSETSGAPAMTPFAKKLSRFFGLSVIIARRMWAAVQAAPNGSKLQMFLQRQMEEKLTIIEESISTCNFAFVGPSDNTGVVVSYGHNNVDTLRNMRDVFNYAKARSKLPDAPLFSYDKPPVWATNPLFAENLESARLDLLLAILPQMIYDVYLDFAGVVISAKNAEWLAQKLIIDNIVGLQLPRGENFSKGSADILNDMLHNAEVKLLEIEERFILEWANARRLSVDVFSADMKTLINCTVKL